MYLQLAETAREGHVVLRCQSLVSEEDDLVIVEGLTDLCDHFVGEVVGQVDPGELRADCRAKLLRVEVLPLEGGQAVPFRGQVAERPHVDDVARKLEMLGERGAAVVLMGIP